MGFDEGRMVLDSPNGTYFSGQTVQGKLIFQQEKVKTFRGLYVKAKGFCRVHWTTHHTRTVNGRQQSYTVNHDSHEEYINMKIYLLGGESGEYKLEPGSYEYPFHFRLPVNCPSSFEGEYGHVRYEIKAVVDRSFRLDQEKKVAVRVMAPLDLNLDPYCREPLQMEFQDSYCCCCMSVGSSEITVKLPVSGYCPGQSIPIEVSCSNKGNVEISNIKFCITKKLMFIATSAPGQKTDKSTVAEIRKGPVPGNTERNWNVEMEVPAMDVYNLSGCQYIHLEYKFKVIVDPDGCRTDSEDSRKIVIGTIPLVGFQDNIRNPLQDQMPQVTAVTQQPTMSSYPPVINAYPDGTPLPLGNPLVAPPYPTTIPTQPYPPGNSPYPAANPPYPTNDIVKSPLPNSPYLAANSPYPSTSPYPATGSPYPTSNPPYPGGNSYPDNPPPYPGVNSPYPAANPPYPTANPPYPTTNSPYPPQSMSNETKPNVTSMPSPGNMGGTFLRTGNLGFVQSSRMNLPLLSPGAAALNPVSPVPTHPYSSASAPAAESPDVPPNKY